jgi:aerobic carbon-monoxide dehydrogenase medium subunit
VKPAPFTYHLARDVAEAIALLTELGEDAKILAGGQSPVSMMNLRLARPSALVDITRIPGLSYLQAGPDGLWIGAMTRHRAVETTRDPAVLGGFGVLPRSARWTGHYPIRVGQLPLTAARVQALAATTTEGIRCNLRTR